MYLCFRRRTSPLTEQSRDALLDIGVLWADSELPPGGKKYKPVRMCECAAADDDYLRVAGIAVSSHALAVAPCCYADPPVPRSVHRMTAMGMEANLNAGAGPSARKIYLWSRSGPPPSPALALPAVNGVYNGSWGTITLWATEKVPAWEACSEVATQATPAPPRLRREDSTHVTTDSRHGHLTVDACHDATHVLRAN